MTSPSSSSSYKGRRRKCKCALSSTHIPDCQACKDCVHTTVHTKSLREVSTVLACEILASWLLRLVLWSLSARYVLQLQASRRLVSLGFYFGAFSIADSSPDALHCILCDIQAAVEAIRANLDKDAALQSWLWDDLDRRLFVESFARVPAVQEYAQACEWLPDAGLRGLHQLLDIELRLMNEVRG